MSYSAYWAIKILSAVFGDSPVNNCKEFARLYYREFIISLIALVLVADGGTDLPDAIGKITSPLSAVAVGGMLPSISMNVFAASIPWVKKLVNG